jgi:hypothetical protein
MSPNAATNPIHGDAAFETACGCFRVSRCRGRSGRTDARSDECALRRSLAAPRKSAPAPRKRPGARQRRNDSDAGPAYLGRQAALGVRQARALGECDVAIEDAVAALARAGLVNRWEVFVVPSRAALRFKELAW